MLLNFTMPDDDGCLDMEEGDEEVLPSPSKLSFTKKISSMELTVQPPSPPSTTPSMLGPVPEEPALTKNLSSKELLIEQLRKRGGNGRLRPVGQELLTQRSSSLSGSAQLGRVLGAAEAKFKIESQAEEKARLEAVKKARVEMKKRPSDLEVICQTILRESARTRP